MEPMFVVQAQNHHIWLGQLLENGERWWTPLTPQDADALAWAIGNALSQLDSEREGRMYAGRDLFTEYGEALTRVRSVNVGEVEA